MPHLRGFGTTIFAEMSALALATGSINLGQGFPDTDGPAEVADAAVEAIRAGHNQYPPGPGIPALRAAIARHQARFWDIEVDPDREVLVTAGATEALAAALLALCQAGDEVVAFEPVYDSYRASVAMAGATLRVVTLEAPDWSVDLDAVDAAITPATRVLLLNSPHNPTGKVFSETELTAIAELCVRHDLLAIADEVYEHITFDGARHESLARYPDIASRAVVISSFGKTYHTTGWKVGYCAAPRQLTAEIQRVHQFVTFTVNGAIQMAYADFVTRDPLCEDLARFYQAKRDLFLRLIEGSRFRPLPCRGTYFQMLDYSAITGDRDADVALRLITDHGVASIPTSAFLYGVDPGPVLRFCFAKRDETLERAAARLRAA